MVHTLRVSQAGERRVQDGWLAMRDWRDMSVVRDFRTFPDSPTSLTSQA